MKFYTATKSRNQGRESWSIIFRHPARLDIGSDKTGRRVRRGLGTTDDVEASRLVDEINEILRTPALWDPAARGTAAAQFDARVVEIFYDGMEAVELDFADVREQLLPLPSAAEGYRTVLMLGTTGAGKTTVVRQMLGTHPKTERFPSTSTAKTTVADTELILAEGQTFHAAVTFTPRDEVIDYLTENVSSAALAAFNGRSDAEITRRLLDHVNQRFRLSYVLGRAAAPNDDDLADDDDDSNAEDETVDPADYGQIDVEASRLVVQKAVQAVRAVIGRNADDIRAEYEDGEDDERVTVEYIEENLDTALRRSDEFHEIVDTLIEEVEKRFSTLDVGVVRRNRQGWPVSWSWSTEDRKAFIKYISRFSSNHAPLFGRLLTPLVNGIRVMGPFTPEWAAEPAKLVLMDGEGLGHAPKSVATLSTSVAARLEQVDAVLLVDNAMQPMQAAPVAALKGIAVSGNAMKLHFLFTHFDQVKGPNMPTFSAREEHVLASAENVLKAVGDDLGPAAERVLRRRLDAARFFVGNIHERLEGDQKVSARSIKELRRLLDLLAHPDRALKAGLSRPVYDRMNLSLAVTEAARNFHARWRGILGLDINPEVPKEHWTRVKALSRRLAEGWTDEYDTLKPVADLRFELQRQVYLMLQQPVQWTHGEPTDDERQAVIDDISNAVTKKLIELARRRMQDDVRLGWQTAYSQSGPGSTFTRARIIASDVYDKGAPVPTVSASPDQNRFLKDVAGVVSEVAQELRVVLD